MFCYHKSLVALPLKKILFCGFPDKNVIPPFKVSHKKAPPSFIDDAVVKINSSSSTSKLNASGGGGGEKENIANPGKVVVVVANYTIVG